MNWNNVAGPALPGSCRVVAGGRLQGCVSHESPVLQSDTFDLSSLLFMYKCQYRPTIVTRFIPKIQSKREKALFWFDVN